MTVVSEENSGVAPSASSLPVELHGAKPLLVSVKVAPLPADTTSLLAELEAKGAHIVRREITSSTERHYYKVVYDQPRPFDIMTFFTQPSLVATEALLVAEVQPQADGTIAHLPNTGSTVAHVDPGTGSTVAHGSFGPNTFRVSDVQPVYYFVVGLPAGNTPASARYTLVAVEA
jgi:hypothetical protein